MQITNANLSLEDRIDLACDRLEEKWKANQPRSIEPLLNGFPNQEQPFALRELLGVEIERRLARGEPVAREDYLQRWPDFKEIVLEVFEQSVQEWMKRTLPANANGQPRTMSPESTKQDLIPRK